MGRTEQRIRRHRTVLWYRQEGLCAYCAEPVPLDQSTFDHVHPKAHGGSNALTNGAMACRPCNEAKGASLAWVT